MSLKLLSIQIVSNFVISMPLNLHEGELKAGKRKADELKSDHYETRMNTEPRLTVSAESSIRTMSHVLKKLNTREEPETTATPNFEEEQVFQLPIDSLEYSMRIIQQKTPTNS